MTNESIDEIDSHETTTAQGHKIQFKLEDQPIEDAFSPQIAGIIDRDGDGDIMNLEEYQEFLKVRYWNLPVEEKKQIQMQPPLARGSPAEIYAVCTRKSKKDYEKLSAPETLHWKTLSKTSRAILKKAEIEYHKILNDQLVLYLQWRNSSAASNTLKRLTDEEIAETRRKYKVRTDNQIVLANFACYLGIIQERY